TAAEIIFHENLHQVHDYSSDETYKDSRSYPIGGYRGLYTGWDVARNRDLSVIWFIERVGDISWTRGVIEMRDQSTPSQMAEARKLMPMIRRLVIDKSSMGLTIYEQLYQEFGDAIEGVQFTLATKETLAVGAKRR